MFKNIIPPSVNLCHGGKFPGLEWVVEIFNVCVCEERSYLTLKVFPVAQALSQYAVGGIS